MAWQVYDRTPSGAAKSYIDPNTSEVISARQYRNRTEAAKSGYATISQKQRVQLTSYTVATYPKIKNVHHIYNIGTPIDVVNAASAVIDKSPQFGIGMFLLVETSAGPKQTKIFKKSKGNLPFLVKSISAVTATYGQNTTINNWYVGLVDYL